MRFLWLGLVLMGGMVMAQTREHEATRINNAAVDAENLEEKLRGFRQAVSLDSNDPIIWLNLMATYARLRRHEEALKTAEDALLKFPHSEEILWARLNYLQDFGLAARARFELLRLQPLAKADEMRRNFIIQNDTPEFVLPLKGEIRLEGLVTSLTKDSLTMEVAAYVLPDKRLISLPFPKTKVLPLPLPDAFFGFNAYRSGPVYRADFPYGYLPLSFGIPGDFIFVVGRETPKGFVARDTYFLTRTEEEETKRGRLFSDYKIEPSDKQAFPQFSPKLSNRAHLSLKNGQKLKALAASLVHENGKTALVFPLAALQSLSEHGDLLKPFLRADFERLKKQLAQFSGAIELETLEEKPLLLRGDSPKIVSVFPGGDLVLIPVESENALTLAPQPPARGQDVYIAGWRDYTIACEGTVAFQDDKRLFLRADEAWQGQRFPGSPIFNPKGEVVGLMVGGDTPYISAVSLAALRAAFKKVLFP